MSPLRPDLVDTWIFRVQAGDGREADRLEILLLRRAAGRVLAGLWQPVSGRLEPGERIALAALRELHEETGLGPSAIEAFFDLDQVNQFHWPAVDAIVSSVIFAVRLRSGVEPSLSHEHDAAQWLAPSEASRLAVWPGYRESIRRIEENLLDPGRARWFQMSLAGDRLIG